MQSSSNRNFCLIAVVCLFIQEICINRSSLLSIFQNFQALHVLHWTIAYGCPVDLCQE